MYAEVSAVEEYDLLVTYVECWHQAVLPVRKNIGSKALDHGRVSRRFVIGQSIDATMVNPADYEVLGLQVA